MQSAHYSAWYIISKQKMLNVSHYYVQCFMRIGSWWHSRVPDAPRPNPNISSHPLS